MFFVIIANNVGSTLYLILNNNIWLLLIFIDIWNKKSILGSNIHFNFRIAFKDAIICNSQYLWERLSLLSVEKSKIKIQVKMWMKGWSWPKWGVP